MVLDFYMDRNPTGVRLYPRSKHGGSHCTCRIWRPLEMDTATAHWIICDHCSPVVTSNYTSIEDLYSRYPQVISGVLEYYTLYRSYRVRARDDS